MKTLTLGKKIALGFGALILIALILGGVAVIVMHSSSSSAQILSKEYAAELEIVGDLQQQVAAAQLSVRTYGLNGDEKEYEKADKLIDAAKAKAQEAKELSVRAEHLPKLRADIDPYMVSLKNYEAKFDETVKIQREIKTSIQTFYTSGAEFSENITGLFNTQFEKLEEEIASKATIDALKERAVKLGLIANIRNETNQVRLATSRTLIDRDVQYMKKALSRFDTIDKLLAGVTPMVHQPANIEQLNKIKQCVANYRGAMEKLANLIEENAKVMAERNVYGKEMREGTDQIYDAALKATVSTANLSATSLTVAKSIMIAGLLIAVAVGVALSVLITRSITVPIRLLIDRLTAGSEQTAAAAGQVSSASQSLAEGASEQAASLEETSSSLEEMASMTAHNAENASNAKGLASEARLAADTGTGEMLKMNTAMEAIKKSSDDISKIIKTIDEIAFQTNILALNAAVEAARAGEAGMGFAVVADEVRSLAHRSAIAAKETADKIQDAISKSEQGVEISGSVSIKLKEVVEKAHKVDELVAEIASASREQSTGITQVNVAVSQMDKVTQSNASSAEETAAAAEELNAQSEELRNAVMDLQRMVGGGPEDSATRSSSPAPARKKLTTSTPAPAASTKLEVKRDKPVSAPSRMTAPSRNQEPLSVVSSSSRQSSIPMDEDFKDM